MSNPHFSARARVQAMLDVEAALAEAEAATGTIPREAATAIRVAARADLFDIAAVEAEAERAGNLAIPLVRHLTTRVAATARSCSIRSLPPCPTRSGCRNLT